MTSEVLDAINGIADSFTSYKQTTDRRFAELQDRIEGKESLLDRLARAPGDGSRAGFSKDQHEHKAVFCDWLRRPKDGPAQRHLEEAQVEMQHQAQREGKAVTVASPTPAAAMRSPKSSILRLKRGSATPTYSARWCASYRSAAVIGRR